MSERTGAANEAEILQHKAAESKDKPWWVVYVKWDSTVSLGPLHMINSMSVQLGFKLR